MHFNQALVTNHKTVRFRADSRFDDACAVSQQTVLDPDPDINNFTLIEYDTEFNFTFFNDAVLTDGRKGSEETVFDEGIAADHNRAPDNTVDDFSAFFQNDLTGHSGVAVDRAGKTAFCMFQDEPVGFQNVFRFTSVLPPTGNFGVTDMVIMIKQILVRVRYFQLPQSRSWSDC